MPNIRTIVRRYHIHQPRLWLERLVVWGIAACAALCVVAFVDMCAWGLDFFSKMHQRHFWLSLLLPPSGGMIIVFLVQKFCAGSEGSGIPQVIACLEASSNDNVWSLVSLRIVIGKMLLGALAMATGFSTGREGPCVQIAAGVMRAGEWLLPEHSQIRRDELLLAGGAAGIAAAFNTPLAGIVFSIEELARRFEQRTHAVLLTAIVIAGMVSISFLGNYLYFGHLAVRPLSVSLIIPVLVCGVICGLTGGLFSQALLWSGRHLPHLYSWRQEQPVLFAGLVGLIISFLGLISHGSIHGSGYDVTRIMLMGGSPVAWYYAPLKWIATALSFHSGVPGGIFAPSLAVGAGIAQDLRFLVHGTADMPVLYALCMAGFLAAVTQSPMTSTIIVMEMIDGHSLVISLVAVTLLSSIVSHGLGEPLYHQLGLRYIKRWNKMPTTTPKDTNFPLEV